MGVLRQLLEAVLIAGGFGGGAETNLIRRNHAIALLAQCVDGVFPGGSAEVFTVHQHHCLTIGLLRRLHVHIAHAERLLLGGEGKMLQRMRIVKSLQLLAIHGL